MSSTRDAVERSPGATTTDRKDCAAGPSCRLHRAAAATTDVDDDEVKPASRRRQRPWTSADVDSSSVVDSSETAAPDGGWGWAVVAASFTAHLIADGFGFSFGVLFAELLVVFGETRGRTALIGSLFVSVPLICGPVAGAVTTRLGCRWTTIIGAVIASVGCFASAFTNSVAQLCLTFGVVAGFGLALVFVPAVIVVAFYFEKNRAFATGIAVAGSGIGTFVFAPLTEWLLTTFLWRGALVVCSAILLNIVVCGAVYRPLSAPHRHRRRLSSSRDLTDVAAVGRSGVFGHGRSSAADMTALGSGRLVPIHRSRVAGPANVTLNQSSSSIRELPRLGSRRAVDGSHQSAPGVSSASVLHLPVDGCRRPCQRISTSAIRLYVGDCTSASLRPADATCGVTLRRRDLAHRGGLVSTALLLHAGHRWSSCPDVFDERSTQMPVATGTAKSGESAAATRVVDAVDASTVRRSRRLRRRFAVDLTVFRSVVFNYFCVHTMLLYVSYDVPYIYGPARAVARGMAPNAASFLVSVIGISSTIGQVAIGYVGDRPSIDTLAFYNLMTSMAGLAVLLVPLVTSFPALAAASALYGLFVSANYALTTVILIELVGRARLTDAVGIVSFAQGIANLVGPPLAGWLSDITGSYDVAFYGAGVTIFLSGLMLFLAPCIGRIQRGERSASGGFDAHDCCCVVR